MSNDDDLYGDLYGNDAGDFNGYEDEQPEANEETKESSDVAKPVQAASKSSTADTKPITGTSKVETTTGLSSKADEPLTNPIPTFTEDSHSSGSMGARNMSSTSNLSTTHGLPPNPGGAPIHTIESVDSSRQTGMKDEGKMFVGGLNWDTTDDGLRNYFSQFGRVEACTIMRDPAGRSRGFAFLTFEDPAAVNKVMVQEHYLDGKIIDPKRAIPRTEHQRTVKMFVGGLAPSVTNEGLKEYFGQFGKVIDATVMVDRDSSRSKGFGFVTFDDQSGAERLFGMPGLAIDGKTIEVKMAQPRAGLNSDRNPTRGAGYNNNTNNYNSMGMAAGGGGSGATSFDPQALATLYQRMAQLAGGGQGGMGWGMGMNGGMGMNPGMGMGMNMGMGMMNNPMMGGGMNGGTGAPGMGGGGMRGGGGMNDGAQSGGMRGGNVPRGPAAMRGGPPGNIQGGGQGAGGMAGVPTGPSGGLGPARMGRGHQHNYHPYSR